MYKKLTMTYMEKFARARKTLEEFFDKFEKETFAKEFLSKIR